MRIVVNTFISIDDLHEHDFIHEIFTLIARLQPQHEFTFLTSSSKGNSNNDIMPDNVMVHIIPDRPYNLLSVLWWYNVKLPKFLKRHKPDVLVNAGGMCSLVTTIPQVTFIHDLNIPNYPGLLPKFQRFFHKLCMPFMFRKAEVVTAVSEFLKEKIASDYNIPKSKLTNIKHAASPVFKPLSWDERESIKEQYSGGVEYFVYVNTIYSQKHHFINLLKAFSVFKKRQLTNMKLLVTGHFAQGNDDPLEKLKTYKYQNDVEVAVNLPLHEYARVMAAAYALVYPGYYEGFSLAVIEAMMCDVPVIASKDSTDEIGGDAVLYIDTSDPSDISEQMKRVFKDENLRTHLIERGRLQAENFSPEKSAFLMWQAIQQATSK